MATDSYIQIPPDGVGKKLYTHEHAHEGNQVHVQGFMLMDSADVSNHQKVDNRGQAYTRFAEGSPSMDAFGNLRVSSANVLGVYEYSVSSYADLFTDEVLAGGAVTHVPVASETHLNVTDASGSSAIRTTNRYHYYQPGVGNLIITTLSLSDTGKAGNVRRWGYFDEDNGLFWELDGTTLNVVRRSKVSGVVVEERISQLGVGAAGFNGDRINGLGTSGMNIDVSMANFYWIDFAWLGVGAVRFGIIAPDGSRWVCHTFQNPNSHLGAYMGTGSLPVRFENFNTTGTSGASSIKSICCAVYCESSAQYTFWRFDDLESSLKTVTTDTPVMSVRPKLMLDSKINRVGLYPDMLSVYVVGGAVKLTIVDDGTLTGATWAVDSEGTGQADIAASAITGGAKFYSVYLAEGCHNLDLKHLYETNDEGYHTLANATTVADTYILTLIATKLSGTTVQVKTDLCYRELR